VFQISSTAFRSCLHSSDRYFDLNRTLGRWFLEIYSLLSVKWRSIGQHYTADKPVSGKVCSATSGRNSGRYHVAHDYVALSHHLLLPSCCFEDGCRGAAGTTAGYRLRETPPTNSGSASLRPVQPISIAAVFANKIQRRERLQLLSIIKAKQFLLQLKRK